MAVPLREARTNLPQEGNEIPPGSTGRKRKNRSKALAALDEAFPGPEKKQESDGEDVVEETMKEAAGAGRQKGAKNYSHSEQKLLISCVCEIGLLSPKDFVEVCTLYNRVAADKKWSLRSQVPLHQRFEKVSDESPVLTLRMPDASTS